MELSIPRRHTATSWYLPTKFEFRPYDNITHLNNISGEKISFLFESNNIFYDIYINLFTAIALKASAKIVNLF